MTKTYMVSEIFYAMTLCIYVKANWSMSIFPLQIVITWGEDATTIHDVI